MSNDQKSNPELMLKHLEEQLEEIKKERENLSRTIEKLMTNHTFENAEYNEKANLEVWKQSVDEHSKIAVEHLKILENHLEETKKEYLKKLQ